MAEKNEAKDKNDDVLGSSTVASKGAVSQGEAQSIALRSLVSKAKHGDVDAFSILYKECYLKIYRYVYVRLGAETGGKQLAEDITQEVFLRLYQSIEKISVDSGSPLAYMYITARNLVIDHSRKKREQVLPTDDFTLDSLAGDEPSPEEEAILKETSGHAISAISELPEAVQEVIIFTYIHSYSTPEICEITGKSPEAIRKLKSRGLGLLRYILRARYEGK